MTLPWPTMTTAEWTKALADVAAAKRKRRDLARDLPPDWQTHREGLVKRFVFTNRRCRAAFLERLSAYANKVNHHPDVHTEELAATVTYVTHSAGNTITEKDHDGAREADRIAALPDVVSLGSAASGNYGHAGRPGEVGGSAPGGAPEYLPHDQRRVVEHYVQGDAYVVNGFLRERGRKARGEPSDAARPWFHEPMTQKQVEEVSAMDTAIRLRPLADDRTFYRTVPDSVVRSLNVGDVYQDDGFVSTTMDSSRIDDIRLDIGVQGDFHSVLTIQAPKGLGHLDINKEIGYGHNYDHQKEVILPRGLQYEVVSKVGKALTVKVRQ